MLQQTHLVIQHVPKKPLRIFRIYWMIFSKTDFKILKLVVYPRHLKKKLAF